MCMHAAGPSQSSHACHIQSVLVTVTRPKPATLRLKLWKQLRINRNIEEWASYYEIAQSVET